MGEAFITRRGGASKIFAVIGVTYPAGSTVTCTNGTKTLTAKDTTGEAMFIIPSAGTWTVTAVDGDKTKSATVEITTEGQVETVKLSFAVVLFDNDSGLISSLSVNSRAKVMDGEPKYIVFMSGYYNISGYLTPKFDFTPYKTLTIKGCAASSGNTKTFGLWSTPDTGEGKPVASVKMPYGTSPTTYTLDVSSLNNSYYIGSDYYNGNAYVYELTLEEK